MLLLFTNELTWAIIARPENEHKKLIIANLKFRGILRLHVMLQPLVISILPKNNAYKEFSGRENSCSVFLKNMDILLLFFIKAIITEKIIINPPIDKTVCNAFSIEFFIAVPKLYFLLEHV